MMRIARAVLGVSLMSGTLAAADFAGMSGGTLVVMVPTAEGLVIAADSRVTIAHHLYCDNAFKIFELEQPVRTVVTVTGFSFAWNFTGVLPEDICRLVRSGERTTFDVAQIARDFVGQATDHASIRMDELAETCVKTTNEVAARDPALFAPLNVDEGYQVVVATFEPQSRTSIVRSFDVKKTPAGALTARDFQELKFSPDDRSTVKLFGEGSYVINNVMHGVGHQFLGTGYRNYAGKDQAVAEIAPSVAADFATDLIEAAAKTMSLVSARTGIGGPVDVLLLGAQPRAQRLRWKD